MKILQFKNVSFFPKLTSGQNHELLHGQLVASMRATVDHIKSRGWQNDVGVTSQISNVPVKKY